MREFEPLFDEAGINVRFVAIGTPELVQKFCARFGDEQRCIADPDKASYRAMGLEDFNLLHLFTHRALKVRRKENAAAGFRQNWRATRLENAAQLPGAAVIDRDGNIRWLHRGTHPGDLPAIREMYERARDSTTFHGGSSSQ